MKINLKTVLVTSVMTLHGLAACAAAAGEDERPASPRTALRACENALKESQKDLLRRLVENEEDFYKNLKLIKALNEAEKDGTLTRVQAYDLQYMKAELALKHLEMRKGLKEAEGGAVPDYRQLVKLQKISTEIASGANPNFDLFHNHLKMFKALKEVAKVTPGQQFGVLSRLASADNPDFELFHKRIDMLKAFHEVQDGLTARDSLEMQDMLSADNPDFKVFDRRINVIKMDKAVHELEAAGGHYSDIRELKKIINGENPDFDLFQNSLKKAKMVKALDESDLRYTARCELEKMIKAANPDLNAFYEKLEKLRIK